MSNSDKKYERLILSSMFMTLNPFLDLHSDKTPQTAIVLSSPAWFPTHERSTLMEGPAGVTLLLHNMSENQTVVFSSGRSGQGEGACGKRPPIPSTIVSTD